MRYLLAAAGGFFGGTLVVSSGGGSFFTYPLLLGLGLSPRVANATSSVGLFPGWMTVVPMFRREMFHHRRYIAYLLLPSFIGAIVGSYLLTLTSDELFGFIAPVLIFGGAMTLHYRARISRWADRIHLHTEKRRLGVVTTAIFGAAAYSSFFGAGVGIVVLALLSFLEIDNLIENIAIKNAVVLVANGVGVVYFLWADLAEPLFSLAIAAGSIPGAIFGARLIHKIPERVVRRFIIWSGVIASVVLMVIRLS